MRCTGIETDPHSFMTSVSIRRFVEVCLDGNMISFTELLLQGRTYHVGWKHESWSIGLRERHGVHFESMILHYRVTPRLTPMGGPVGDIEFLQVHAIKASILLKFTCLQQEDIYSKSTTFRPFICTDLHQNR